MALWKDGKYYSAMVIESICELGIGTVVYTDPIDAEPAKRPPPMTATIRWSNMRPIAPSDLKYFVEWRSTHSLGKLIDLPTLATTAKASGKPIHVVLLEAATAAAANARPAGNTFVDGDAKQDASNDKGLMPLPISGNIGTAGIRLRSLATCRCHMPYSLLAFF
jgi:hypothetical protein